MSSTTPQSPPVSLQAGRYLLDTSHDGGMAHVFNARDTAEGRDVVVKMAPSSSFSLASSLIRERETLVRLRHPGVVRCLDLFDEEGWTCLVLEHVEGQNLGQVLAQRDLVIDEARLRDWGTQVAEIITYLHEQSPPLIFRDIKPSNLMMSSQGRLTLIDFGASRVKSSGAKDTVHLGTPGYAAPEQYAHTEGASDERSDVYGLGATLYELATGRDPESFRFDFPPLSTLGITVSPDFEAVVSRSVATDPAARYASMREMLRALQHGPAPRSQRPLALAGASALVAGAALTLSGLKVADASARISTYQASSLLIWVGCALLGHVLGTWQARQAHPARSARAAVVLGAVAGLLPILLPMSWVYSIMMRVGFVLGQTSLPLVPAHATMHLLALLAAVAGLLSGLAPHHRAGRVGLATFLAFIGSLGGGALLCGYASDRVRPVAADASAPLWTMALPTHRLDAPMHMSTLIDRLTSEAYLGLRRENGAFAIVRARDGKLCWELTTTVRHPHVTGGGCILTLEGTKASAHALQDGKIAWTSTLPASALNVYDSWSASYLGLDNSSVLALSNTDGKVLWTWKAPGAQSNQKPNVYMCQDDLILVTTASPPRLNALRSSDGTLAWSVPCDLGHAFRIIPLTGRVLWASNTQLRCIDVADGKELYALSVPGVDSTLLPGPMLTLPCDSDHMIALRGQQVSMLDVTAGRIDWTLPMLDPLAMIEPGMLGSACISLSGDRLQGVDLTTARARWEVWLGSLGSGVTQKGTLPPFVRATEDVIFCQAASGGNLVGLDSRSGARVYERSLPTGDRITYLNADTQRLYVVTSRHGQGSQLTVLPLPRVAAGHS